MIVLTGGLAVTGFMRGFVEESLSLLAWLAAVVAIRLFLAPVTDLAGIWLGTSAAPLAAFGGLFILTFWGGKMLAKWVGNHTRNSLLGPIDRVLGGGFGAVKGLVIATLAFLAFTLAYGFFLGSKTERPEWLTQARSYPLLQASGNALRQFMRDGAQMRENAESAFEAVEE